MTGVLEETGRRLTIIVIRCEQCGADLTTVPSEEVHLQEEIVNIRICPECGTFYIRASWKQVLMDTLVMTGLAMFICILVAVLGGSNG